MTTLYLRRRIDDRLDDLLIELPAVMIVGPRAAGKTTTIARRAATVISLDVPARAAAFRADPDAALRGLPEPVLLDEWQEVPEVLGAVQRAVDADPRPGRYLLTGSVRKQLAAGVWPGTGRVVRVTMYPMTIAEQRDTLSARTFLDRLSDGEEIASPRQPPDLRGYVELALAGGFPRPLLSTTGTRRRAWYESYIEDLLTHDVDRLAPTRTRRRDSGALRRYFEACAANSAGIPEHKTLYDAARINRLTAVEYDGLLAGLFALEQVPAWATNRLKRLTQTRKRYLLDAALVGAMLSLDVRGVLADGDLLGRILDTFVAAQLRPEAAVSAAAPRLFHLRTKAGEREVDLLIELGGGRVIGIEVKASAAPDSTDAAALEWMREQLGDRFIAGVVFHTGPQAFRLAERVTALPIATIWEP